MKTSTRPQGKRREYIDPGQCIGHCFCGAEGMQEGADGALAVRCCKCRAPHVWSAGEMAEHNDRRQGRGWE